MFGQIIEILNLSPIVADYEIRQLIEEHTANFLRIEVTLVDGSRLFIKELLFPDGEKYSYHWQGIDGQLLIRWDNAPYIEIPTYPHHKHVGEDVVSSSRILLEEVLLTITSQIKKQCDNDGDE